MKWNSKFFTASVFLISCSVYADSYTVLIITSQNTPLYTQTTKGISDNIDSNIKLIIMGHSPGTDLKNTALDKTNLIITVGYEATNYILSDKPIQPTISILIPKSSFISLRDKQQNNMKPSAIFIDQPIQRQASSMKKFLPHIKSVGIISSLQESSLDDKISKLKKYFSIKHKSIDQPTDMLNAFREISFKSDVILAIPDNLIYNKNTIKRILVSSYHLNTPLIGYSSALTRAGALMSVSTPPYHIGKEAAEIINEIQQNGYKSFEKHPKYYMVTTNERVARSMKVPINHIDLINKIQKD